MKMNRRQLLKITGAASLLAFVPELTFAAEKKEKASFRFCLNTSTISGQKSGLLQYIDIAAKAGYDGIELWISDVKDYIDKGNTIASLRKHITDSKITVENAIGFAQWLVDDEKVSSAAFEQMKSEMLLMAELGCNRIAASPAGLKQKNDLNLNLAGEKYKKLIELGRETGVMPQLEFWGSSGTLFQLSQALFIAAAANDPDVKILADVYHLFRGNSGFNGLKMLKGNVIEIFHMNDYVTDIPRESQSDKDRVFPGDGCAPLKQILTDLAKMGGPKVLSLELFNETYWRQDALLVAKTGLDKMKAIVKEISL